MNCNTTHYRANSSSVPGDPTERWEAEALAHAARSGAHVINCSWGPPDGAWWDPRDPLHARVAPLPDVVAAAMRFAVGQGRGGRGCVLVWAAGNGNESVSNDGYASSPLAIAVAACNHHDRRSVYSDYGPEVSVAAPSSDIEGGRRTVGGIWTTDRRGGDGYNPGGDATDSFGGTSAAAPLVAGIVALMLAVNPELTRDAVRSILETTAEPVEPDNPTWHERDGVRHSDMYGAGRVDAARAVAAALAAARSGTPEAPRTRRASRRRVHA